MTAQRLAMAAKPRMQKSDPMDVLTVSIPSQYNCLQNDTLAVPVVSSLLGDKALAKTDRENANLAQQSNNANRVASKRRGIPEPTVDKSAGAATTEGGVDDVQVGARCIIQCAFRPNGARASACLPLLSEWARAGKIVHGKTVSIPEVEAAAKLWGQERVARSARSSMAAFSVLDEQHRRCCCRAASQVLLRVALRLCGQRSAPATFGSTVR